LSDRIRKNWIREFGEDSLLGNCYTINRELSKELIKRNIKHMIIFGWIKIDNHKWAHSWIETNEKAILDPAKVYAGEYLLRVRQKPQKEQ